MVERNQSPGALSAALELGATSLYDCPAYYDKAYRHRRADVSYYVRTLSARPGPVLELGAGSGRITLALARVGLQVTAVDASAAMLGVLRENLSREPRHVQRRVHVQQADMRSLDLGKRFAWVIAPFNTVLHLYTLDDMAGFLGAVRRHCKPRGRLLFDYATPRVSDLAVSPERWYKGRSFIDPETKKRVAYAERFHYSPQRQVLSTWLRFTPHDGTAAWELLLTHRQYFPLEMRALLAFHGFSKQHWTADFTDGAPSALSDVLVVEALADQPRSVRAKPPAPGSKR